ALIDAGEALRERGVSDRRRMATVVSEVGGVIRAELPTNSELFRLGDDKFAVLLLDQSRADGLKFAEALVQRARRVLSLEGAPLSIAIGVAASPENGTVSEDILVAAETALQAARASDGVPVAAFDGTLGSVAPEAQRAAVRLRTMRATVQALAKAVDARDSATRDHSANVSELASGLAQVLGLPGETVQLLELAGLVHDVGKIGISDDILLKAGRLSDEERAAIERHCELGVQILTPARLYDVLPAVRHHHERWDGAGYPEGLAGHDIPLEARILCVCDAFESMTAGRPYRAARSTEEALDELRACAGTQFDPVITPAFIRMIAGLRTHLDADRRVVSGGERSLDL
ncbi:MAG: HD-GYP domain-containing protein, partial [Actinobacteria bacterium]